MVRVPILMKAGSTPGWFASSLQGPMWVFLGLIPLSALGLEPRTLWFSAQTPTHRVATTRLVVSFSLFLRSSNEKLSNSNKRRPLNDSSSSFFSQLMIFASGTTTVISPNVSLAADWLLFIPAAGLFLKTPPLPSVDLGWHIYSVECERNTSQFPKEHLSFIKKNCSEIMQFISWKHTLTRRRTFFFKTNV